MSQNLDELRVSDLMKSDKAVTINKDLAFNPNKYFQNNKKQLSIFKKLYPANRKKILLYPLSFLLLLSIYQVFLLYTQSSRFEMKVTFNKNADEGWILQFPFANYGVTLESIKKSQELNTRVFLLKRKSDDRPHRLISALENNARVNFIKKLEVEKDFILNQIETIKLKILQNKIAGSPDLLQLRSDQEIHAYLLYGEESLKKRVEYYHKVLYIDDFARHNVLEIFRLRKKELEIPLLKELENLSVIIKKDSPEAVKELIERIKIQQDEYLSELMQREMEDIPDKYLTPARKELLQEEKKLRVLYHDWKMSESLFQAYQNKLEKNKSDSIDKLFLQSDLRLTENWLKKREEIELETGTNHVPIKITLAPLPATGISILQLSIFTLLFVLFYISLWAKMIFDEKRFPTIESVEELEERLKLSVAHQISFEDISFDTEKLEVNSFYQQVGAYYSQNKNIISKTDLILFQSCQPGFNRKDLAYLYALGIAAANGRVCLVDTLENGKWEYFGQLDRSLSLGLIDTINGKCDLKDCVYGTEYRNIFVSPLNLEQRISKSKSDLNVGAQWDSKFDKIVLAINDILIEDIIVFFKNHRVIIYYVISQNDQLNQIKSDIESLRAKNAEVKIIFIK